MKNNVIKLLMPFLFILSCCGNIVSAKIVISSDGRYVLGNKYLCDIKQQSCREPKMSACDGFCPYFIKGTDKFMYNNFTKQTTVQLTVEDVKGRVIKSFDNHSRTCDYLMTKDLSTYFTYSGDERRLKPGDSNLDTALYNIKLYRHQFRQPGKLNNDDLSYFTSLVYGRSIVKFKSLFSHYSFLEQIDPPWSWSHSSLAQDFDLELTPDSKILVISGKMPNKAPYIIIRNLKTGKWKRQKLPPGVENYTISYVISPDSHYLIVVANPLDSRNRPILYRYQLPELKLDGQAFLIENSNPDKTALYFFNIFYMTFVDTTHFIVSFQCNNYTKECIPYFALLSTDQFNQKRKAIKPIKYLSLPLCSKLEKTPLKTVDRNEKIYECWHKYFYDADDNFESASNIDSAPDKNILAIYTKQDGITAFHYDPKKQLLKKISSTAVK